MVKVDIEAQITSLEKVIQKGRLRIRILFLLAIKRLKTSPQVQLLVKFVVAMIRSGLVVEKLKKSTEMRLPSGSRQAFPCQPALRSRH